MFPGPARRLRPRTLPALPGIGALALAGVLTLVLASAASASTAGVPFSGSVSYTAATGETNAVATTISAGTSSGTKKVVFQDPAVTITAGTGCTVDMTGHTATCDNLSIQFVLVNLGDGNDSDTAAGPFHTLGVHLQLFGGSGNDTLNGGDGDDFFGGDDANGAGDANSGTVGNDTIDGGAGYDTVSYFFAPAAVTATVNGTGGTSTETDTYSTIEEIDGSNDFGDTLTTDGTGNNNLKGMGGDDTLNSDDGLADTLDCDFAPFPQNPGTADVANADAADSVNSDCETINRSTAGAGGGGGSPYMAPPTPASTTPPPAASPPPPAPTPPPTLPLTTPLAGATLTGSTLTLTDVFPQAGTAIYALDLSFYSGTTARSAKVHGRVHLASTRVTSGAGPVKVTFHLSKQDRRVMARHPRAKLVVRTHFVSAATSRSATSRRALRVAQRG